MTWGDVARAQYNRKADRYPGDMPDLVAPMIPPARSGDHPRTTDMQKM
ncbi:MAG: hypothetical protein GDA36_11505 [Rhodobacteraceae bacterium]|nr:hypothetical protein [Paracoccaceae bacterium]